VHVTEARWWTRIAVCVATFMLLLDVTIVNVALPYIERSLDASFADLQWVVDAYALTLAAPLLTGGSLADLFGRRLVFIVGLGIFTDASLGALFQHFVASAFVAPAGLAAHAPAGGEIADLISFGDAARSGNEALARAGEQASVTGLNDLLHHAAAVALVGAIAVAALVRQRDFVARAVPA
jgi:MFS family permease